MNKKLILIIAFALLNCQLATAKLTELTSEFKTDTFTKDAMSSWTLEGDFNQAKQVYNCGGKFIAGGFEIAGNGSMSKKFTSSSEFKSISFDLELYLLDEWRNGLYGSYNSNQFQVLINDQVVYTIGFNFVEGQHQCGRNDVPDKKTRISLTVLVNAKEFTIKFKGNYVYNNTSFAASWGIRDLTIYSDDGIGYQIVADLLNDNNFDVSKWDTSFPTKTSTCNGKQLIGGYNNAGARQGIAINLEKLPSHKFLTFSFQAYFIDSFDTDDTIQVWVDQKLVHEQGKIYGQPNICGDSRYAETVQKLVITIPHTADSVYFNIKLKIDQAADDESFGMREFQVFVPSTCTIIYSESNGQGKNLQICGNIPNLKNVGWTYPIKGIFVPQGLRITVYQDADYNGKKFTVDQTDLNLSGQNYVFINKAFGIEIKNNKLKRNS